MSALAPLKSEENTPRNLLIQNVALNGSPTMEKCLILQYQLNLTRHKRLSYISLFGERPKEKEIGPKAKIRMDTMLICFVKLIYH